MPSQSSFQPSWVIATSLAPHPTPGFFVALGQALGDQGTPVTFLVPPLIPPSACHHPPPWDAPTQAGMPAPLSSALRTPHSTLYWPSPRPTGIRDIVFAWRLLRELRPTGLIANFGAVTPLLLAGWLARVPVRVAWYHTLADYDSYDPRLSPRRLRWLNWRRQQVYRLATHVIAVSEAARQDAIRTFDLAPEKCLVIPNAMRDPLEEFPELKCGMRSAECGVSASVSATPANHTGAESPSPLSRFTPHVSHIPPHPLNPSTAQPPYLLCVGTLHRAKGQDVLLRAMARLKPAFPGLRCVFFGEGPAAAKLRQLAADLKVADRCHFAGNRPRLEVLQAMQGAAAVVCPSRSEAFGYVLLEAMALGRPVVAAAAGGIPAIVQDGVAGKLFPAGDDQALAAVLPHVLSTPSEAAAWGRHSRERFLTQFELSRRLPGLIQRLETFLQE